MQKEVKRYVNGEYATEVIECDDAESNYEFTSEERISALEEALNLLLSGEVE